MLGQYEGPGKVFFDSNLLAEATRVRYSINGNNRKQFTMKRGLAGRSRGPVESELTVDNAIPIAGLEADFIEKCIENADVVIIVDVAGKRLQFDGWIDTVEGEQTTDGAASLTFTAAAAKPRIL